MRKEDSLRVGRILRVFNEFVRPARRGGCGLDVAAYHVHGEPVPPAEAFAAAFEPFEVGQAWGPAWDTTWFRLRGTVPADGRGREVRLGLRHRQCRRHRVRGRVPPLPGRPTGPGPVPQPPLLPADRPGAEGGEEVELYVEAAANPAVPFGANPWPLLMAEPDGAPAVHPGPGRPATPSIPASRRSSTTSGWPSSC